MFTRVYSDASTRELSVFVMKRLKRRSRSAGRVAPRDSVTVSLSCLPRRSMLCRARSPSSPLDTEPSPVYDASSRRRRTSTDKINHVDDPCAEAPQPRKNGAAGSGAAALLGGNGLHQYDRFIATLLRERSAVKDGVPPVAIDQPNPRVNKPPPMIAPRLRKRRPLTSSVEGQPGINGFDSNTSRLQSTWTIGKFETLLPKPGAGRVSSGVSASDATTKSVYRPETELSTCWSATEMIKTDAPRSASMRIKAMDRSPRQRRRRSSQTGRYRTGAMNGSCTASHWSEKCATDELQGRDVRVDYEFSPDSASHHSETEIPTDVDVGLTASDERRGSGDGQYCADVPLRNCSVTGSDGLDESCAFRDRLDGYGRVAALNARPHAESPRSDSEPQLPACSDKAELHRQQDSGSFDQMFTVYDRPEDFDTVTWNSRDRDGFELSRRSATIVSDDSEPDLSTHFDQAEANRRHEEGVFGLAVDASTLQFTDCDKHAGVEPFDLETKCQACNGRKDRSSSTGTSLMRDRRRDVGDKLAASSPIPLTISQQCYMPGKCRRHDVPMFRCTVCRRSSTRGGEWTTPARLHHRLCQSQPLLTHLSVDQTSSAADHGDLTRDAAHPSQLLEACKCAIARPKTATLYMYAEQEDSVNYDTQSRQPAASLIPNDIANIISTRSELNPEPSHHGDSHSSPGRRQQPASPFVNLSSNNARPPVHRRSSRDKGRVPTEKFGVDRQVSYQYVAGRCRQHGRGGIKTSRCLLRTELILTRVQTEDQTTTFLFTPRTTATSTADESRRSVDGDSDDLNLPFCRCSTSDVMQTVASDVIDDVIRDGKQSAGCTAAESMETSLQPGSAARALNVCRDQVSSSVDDVVRTAAGAGTVDDATPCDVTSGDLDDVSQSLMVYEFAEVTSIFRNFAADLLPTTPGTELALVPYKAAGRREGDSATATTTTLVRRPGPDVTYSGAVVPYAVSPFVFVPLPLMTWTWRHDDVTGSRLQTENDDVIHIPYVAACTTFDLEPSVDTFTLITPPSRNVSSEIQGVRRGAK